MPKPPTLQDLLARFQISEGQLKAKLSDEHLPAIARLINHGILGPELGLTPPEMEAIEADGRTEELRKLNTLRKWKEKYSFMATYQELLEALFRCGMAEHAEKVCNILSPLQEIHPESIQESSCKVPAVQQKHSSVKRGAGRRNDDSWRNDKLTLDKLQLITYNGDKKLRIMQCAQTKWHEIGIELGIPPPVLSGFENIGRGDLNKQCRDVFMKWLEGGSKKYELTWQGLLNLLEAVDLKPLAEEVVSALRSN